MGRSHTVDTELNPFDKKKQLAATHSLLAVYKDAVERKHYSSSYYKYPQEYCGNRLVMTGGRLIHNN